MASKNRSFSKKSDPYEFPLSQPEPPPKVKKSKAKPKRKRKSNDTLAEVKKIRQEFEEIEKINLNLSTQDAIRANEAMELRNTIETDSSADDQVNIDVDNILSSINVSNTNVSCILETPYSPSKNMTSIPCKSAHLALSYLLPTRPNSNKVCTVNFFRPQYTKLVVSARQYVKFLCLNHSCYKESRKSMPSVGVQTECEDAVFTTSKIDAHTQTINIKSRTIDRSTTMARRNVKHVGSMAIVSMSNTSVATEPVHLLHKATEASDLPLPLSAEQLITNSCIPNEILDNFTQDSDVVQSSEHLRSQPLSGITSLPLSIDSSSVMRNLDASFEMSASPSISTLSSSRGSRKRRISNRSIENQPEMENSIPTNSVTPVIDSLFTTCNVSNTSNPHLQTPSVAQPKSLGDVTPNTIPIFTDNTTATTKDSSAMLDHRMCEEYHLLTSGFSKAETRKMHEFINLCKGTLHKEFSDRITHVIFKYDDDTLKCQRTLKYFQAISVGIWLISLKWVEDSLQYRRVLSCEPYEITGDTVCGAKHYGPKASRNEANSASRLFTNYRFYLANNFTVITNDQMKTILSAAGAELLPSSSLLGKPAQGKESLIISEFPADDIKAISRRFKVPVVTREWALDSLTKYSVQPITRNILVFDDTQPEYFS